MKFLIALGQYRKIYLAAIGNMNVAVLNNPRLKRFWI